MALLLKGITKLSELNIDADKDWNGKGITNIKQVAAMMAKGDVIARSDSYLVRIPAGPVSYVLTSAGPGKLPTWAPAGGALKYYFPVVISSSLVEAIIAVNQSITKTVSLSAPFVAALGDAPGSNIKMVGPAVGSSRTAAITTINQSQSKTVILLTDMSIPVDGFVSETAAGVQTDQTAAAQSAAINDLTFSPMTPAVNDKVYIGSNFKFKRAWIKYDTKGTGNWTNFGYYWNGAAWTGVISEDDETSSFQNAIGTYRYDHVPQANWAKTTILGYNLYWLKIQTDNFVNQITKPLGSQIWVTITP